MNTNQKGKVTELQVLTKVIEMGYSVSLPFGNSEKIYKHFKSNSLF